MTQGKWQKLSKEEQILNIASEFSRTKNLLISKNEKLAMGCLNRAFELIDLTSNDPRWRKGALKELLRFREVLAEFYLKKDKTLEELIKIFKTLLMFNKFSSLVKI